MKLKKLLSRRSDGAVQQWVMEVEGNKYRATVGKVGGIQHTNNWTEVQGKNIGRANETSPDQQAAAEAQAHWTKKKAEGYCETEEDLTKVTLWEPMLAKVWADYKDKAAFPLWAQPKLDGARCICKPAGLFSRKGKPWISVPHIWESMAPVMAANPTMVVDGELYADKLKDDFNKLISLVKQAKPTAADLAASAKVIRYYVYDCAFTDQPDMVFSERMAKATEILKDNPAVVLVPTYLAKDQAELDARYVEFLEAGYEGEIVRQDVAYANKRTSALLKRKEFVDSEYEITGVVEGTGNRAGTAGAITLANGSKPAFNAGIRGNHEYVCQLLHDFKQLIGKKATIRYQNLSEEGVPRFPVLIAVRDWD